MQNSGSMILLDKTTTGDGIVAGLQVLAAMARNHNEPARPLQRHENVPANPGKRALHRR